MAGKKAAYRRKLNYNNAYNRENYRSFSVRYSINSEQDIIEWLQDKGSVKEYLTTLIRKDMKRASKAKK